MASSDSSAALSELLREQQREEEKTRKDRDAILREWTRVLEVLRNSIRRWLKAQLDSKLLTVDDVAMKVTEQGFGDYEAPGCVIKAGLTSVTVRPAARFIVGGCGRVDLERGMRRSLLVLDEKGQWNVAIQEQGLQLKRLTQGVFLDLLMELLA
jgi:hypothetical protein